MSHLDKVLGPPELRTSNGFTYANVRPRVTCADGFNVSIQASEYHYCQPRDNFGPYQSFELGFPSEAEPLILEYAESDGDPTDAVYGQVPRDVVIAVIEKHGGLK